MEEANETNMNGRHLFRIKCEHSRDEFQLLGRPCELSAFSFVPSNRTYEPPNRSIYNTKTSAMRHQREEENMDKGGFNNLVHRCDRKHAKLLGLNTWDEEIRKRQPSRSSHEYGKKLVRVGEAGRQFSYVPNYLDSPDRKYARIAKVKSEFYNRNGINDLNPSWGLYLLFFYFFYINNR